MAKQTIKSSSKKAYCSSAKVGAKNHLPRMKNPPKPPPKK